MQFKGQTLIYMNLISVQHLVLYRIHEALWAGGQKEVKTMKQCIYVNFMDAGAMFSVQTLHMVLDIYKKW